MTLPSILHSIAKDFLLNLSKNTLILPTHTLSNNTGVFCTLFAVYLSVNEPFTIHVCGSNLLPESNMFAVFIRHKMNRIFI